MSKYLSYSSTDRPTKRQLSCAHFFLASAYDETGNRNRAIEHLEKVDPFYAPGLSLRAKLLPGMPSQNTKKRRIFDHAKNLDDARWHSLHGGNTSLSIAAIWSNRGT